jgi:hypothetical protein
MLIKNYQIIQFMTWYTVICDYPKFKCIVKTLKSYHQVSIHFLISTASGCFYRDHRPIYESCGTEIIRISDCVFTYSFPFPGV